jgi:hypothetical protein
VDSLCPVNADIFCKLIQTIFAITCDGKKDMSSLCAGDADILFKPILRIFDCDSNNNMFSLCTGNADIFCKHILRIFDCDGNDYLDFKEFLMAMDIARCDSGQDRKQLKKATI